MANELKDKLVKKSDMQDAMAPTDATLVLLNIADEFGVSEAQHHEIATTHTMDKYVRPWQDAPTIYGTLERIEHGKFSGTEKAYRTAVVRSLKNERFSIRFLVSGGMARDITEDKVGRAFLMQFSGVADPKPGMNPCRLYTFAWAPAPDVRATLPAKSS